MTYANLWIFSNCYGSGSDGGDPSSGSLAWMPGQTIDRIGETISSVSSCVCMEGRLHSGLPS